MPFPEKFRGLIESAEEHAAVPDYFWMSFALCCVESESCGWSGWIIESAWQQSEGTGVSSRKAVVSADNQKCPHCGRSLFRTALEVRYEKSAQQPPKIAYPYDVGDISYESGEKDA